MNWFLPFIVDDDGSSVTIPGVISDRKPVPEKERVKAAPVGGTGEYTTDCSKMVVLVGELERTKLKLASKRMLMKLETPFRTNLRETPGSFVWTHWVLPVLPK